jgi:hypothetical protein
VAASVIVTRDQPVVASPWLIWTDVIVGGVSSTSR